MNTEDLYDQPKPIKTVNGRVATQPGFYARAGLVERMPAPTGYYPNVRDQIQTPVYGNKPNGAKVGGADDLYPGTIIQDSLARSEKIDQHPYLHVAATWTPAPNTERPSGVQDPLTDGPPQPDLMDLATHYYRRAGTSVTQHLNAPGVKFPVYGDQDGVSWTYVQSTPAVLAPYDPASVDAKGDMPDSQRTLAPSPPHGWTEQPILNAQQENNLKAAKLKQQRPGKQERTANSTFAGQSFGQRTAHVGQQGTTTVSRGRGATGGRGRG